MRKNLKHYIIASLLCVTLLFTLGFGLETRNPGHAGTTSPSVQVNAKEQQTTENNSLPIDQPATVNMTDAPVKSGEPASEPVPINEEQPAEEITNSEETTASYEVTAYYLNVRAEADAASKIVDVVSKGRILEVLKPTDNGWLELKSGGYIHGSYAKLIDEDVKPSSKVRILSYKPTAGSNDVVQAQQPTINNKPAEPSKPSSAVNSNSGLTEEQIAKMFKNTALEGEGLEKAILDVEEMYGINSYFTIAVMKLESGHGKSQIAQTKNNLFGLNALDSDSYNKALSFATKGESVKEFGQIISSFYIDQGLTSIEKVASKYCGVNSNWPVLVKSIMNSDYKKIL